MPTTGALNVIVECVFITVAKKQVDSHNTNMREFVMNVFRKKDHLPWILAKVFYIYLESLS